MQLDKLKDMGDMGCQVFTDFTYSWTVVVPMNTKGPL